MLRTAKLAQLLLIAFAGLQLTWSSAGAALYDDDDHAPFKIVMLRSSNVFSPAAVSQDQQIRKAFEKKNDRGVQFFVEIFDTINFTGSVTDTEFLLRQATVWEQHQNIIVTVIFAVLAQTLLIVALLLHRANRLRSERALEKQLQFERLVAEISATLINTPLCQVDAEVDRALEQVCVFMGLDHCHVFEYSPHLQRLGLTHYCRAGVEQNPTVKLDGFLLPWFFDQLRQGCTIVLEDVVRDLPQEAVEERAYAVRAQVKSMLAVPVRTSENLVHGISLQTTQRYQRWPENLIKRIHLVGEMFISAISRARSEQALRMNEERYRTVVEEQTELVCRFDPDTTLTFVNAAYANYFALKPEELIGRSFLSLIAEADRERALAHIRALAESKQIGFQEHRVNALRGEIKWQQWVDRPILDNRGNLVEFQSVGRDVTEIKRAEEALQQSEERLRLAMQAGRMGMWDWRPGSDAITWSKAQFKIMGFDPAVQPTLSEWTKIVHPDDLPLVRQAFSTAIREKREYRAEYRILRSEGQLRWVFTRGQPIYDDDGKCIRVLGVAADITESKDAERALQAALEEVQRLKERLEAENVYLRAELSDTHRHGEIVGESPAIQKTFSDIAQVAPTNMTVLILGETGTGKELVARAVHERSARRDRPLVKVNCAALPANLIESELFGHEKGAFTGASARHVGRFELANGGTMFLDEIGDLPLSLQTKLLRVLQEGEFERLGSGKTIKVDVRVMAATNRDLEEALRNQTFRHDLYYRLNVYPIRLAPLRERKEDIAILATTFLTEVNRRLGSRCHKVQEDVLGALRRYDWPGNVRELQNVIERAALLSRGITLQLPEGWDTSPASGWIAAKRTAMIAEPRPVDGMTLEKLEREHILEVLQQTGWRIEGPKGAALKLGLHPSTLRSRMLKLKLQRSTGRERNGVNTSNVREI